ncbi:class I mannose-6-phosphate isomerase [Marinococcus sp. PL1-022]|uniref:class I mannose-6-phosphate isomerase n=1 Tax=Marinococcus sp. PL1-022 TaxID=3095363 RepID=UPI0029C500EC|nr:class I mannose-6-phosphate isomerase [Marinococcus sp. PL1-022]MDX6152627.1 class I mannose-6-phosphate isomerase [Marinococcus sp. PL1-022]
MKNYNVSPEIVVSNKADGAWEGYENIHKAILKAVTKSGKEKSVLTIECYPGVNYEELEQSLIFPLKASKIVHSDELALKEDAIQQLIEKNLTDDRVFGLQSSHQLQDFFSGEAILKVRDDIKNIQEGLVIVYGVGARLVCEPDVLIYADLTRWEIQRRFSEEGLSNWKADNSDEELLRKYKRGYFVEWRVADKHKKKLFGSIDFLLDTNLKMIPKMITAENFRVGMKQATQQPFRLVPYFAPGIWGGQWMKEQFGLNESEENYAWSFDGVPEENSVQLAYGDVRVSIPSMNIVFQHPRELLGEGVHARFGDEFPIRFDLLDTMGGQNLSLQVHPITEYIQEHFGMHYTQDESYYLLDAKEDAVVYLGTKNKVNKEEMLEDLYEANDGHKDFPDDKYINKYPAKKHDHFLIPAGTIHCSGANSMVLEISATPYIFTFKLWDWGRLGLDGLPRPVHLEHGKEVIQWERNTEWVEKNLINQVEQIDSGDGWIEERTGLHEREFIETRRHWFSKKVHHHTGGSVNVLNLVEGEEAVVESPDNAFTPFVVHYAETFIIPCSVKEYTIRPYGEAEGKTIVTVKASVRI